jgi:hypothetical protein
MQHLREHSTIAYGFCNTYQALLIQRSVYRCALFSVALCCEENQTKNWDKQLMYTKVGCSVLSVICVAVVYFSITEMLAVILGFVMSFTTPIPWTTASSSLHVPTQNHMSPHRFQAHQLLCHCSFIYISNEVVTYYDMSNFVFFMYFSLWPSFTFLHWKVMG